MIDEKFQKKMDQAMPDIIEGSRDVFISYKRENAPFVTSMIVLFLGEQSFLTSKPSYDETYYSNVDPIQNTYQDSSSYFKIKK